AQRLHVGLAHLAGRPRQLEGVDEERAIGALQLGGVRRRHEGAYERPVSGELAEEAAVELGAVTAAVVRAHRGSDHLLAQLGERPGGPHRAVEIEMGVQQARAHAVGAIVGNDPPQRALDPLVGLLEESFRILLARYVDPGHRAAVPATWPAW